MVHSNVEIYSNIYSILDDKMLIKALFHLFGAIQFFYGCYYDHTYVQLPPTTVRVTPFGGKLKYLTFLDAMIQTLYYTVAFLNDIVGSNDPNPTEKPLIRKTKDLLYCSLAFPLSIFVGITFWGIYIVDRELILPRAIDPYFPTWLNHIMHTNIVFFSLIELVTSFRMYPKKNQGISILALFMFGYVSWVHVIYYKTNSWVYPILSVLNWPLRVAFYVVSLGFACGLYSVGDKLNKTIWSKEVIETVRSGKKKVK